VYVKSALTAPSTPSVSHTGLVVSQTLTVKSTIKGTGTSPFDWEWMVSTNGGAYTLATQCAVDSGSGGSQTVTCTIAGGTLTVGDTYTFELKVADSASAPEHVSSAASKVVTVVS
jgi:hypothetical protein